MTQDQALHLLKLGHNVFLTGPAGSGKTFVLNQYVEYLRRNKVETGITASTGIAATHLGGITIHSWSGLGIKDQLTDEDMVNLLVKSYLRKRINQTKVLIIDEVSMLHAYQLDLIDKVCRAFTESSAPFGGIQIVLCGDLFQLPPVTKGNDQSYFVTAANIWSEANFQVCYLEEQYRQTDQQLESLLNAIRHNEVDEDVFLPLQERLNAKIDGLVQPTKLYSHNLDVDTVNTFELDKIKADQHIFAMTASGNPQVIETLIKGCLAPSKLILKTGAMVMFVKNNFEAGYVNGTIGTIVDWDQDGQPVVQARSGDLLYPQIGSWKVEEDGRTIAELTQLPLRLAWAITIHKSQGMSLDAAEVDLSKSFVPGMGYVALSRLRTLDGLSLKGMNNTALRINEQVLAQDLELQKESELAEDYLNNLSPEAVVDHQLERLASVSSK